MIPGAPQGFKIEWSDDFNGDGQPNSTSWDIRQDGPIKDNGEVQKYSNDKANVFLSGGSMCIAPQRDANKSATDFTLGWTSGRVECLKSFACDPGKQMIFQARLRTGFDPKSQKWNADQQSGVWPAFWALGESFRHPRGSWPGCGEWDIMEKRGDWDHTVPSVHYGTNGTATASLDHKFLSGPDKSFDQGTFQTFSLRVDRSTPGKETLTYMMDQAVMYTLNQAR